MKLPLRWDLLNKYPISTQGAVAFGKGTSLHRPLSNFYLLPHPLRDRNGVAYPTIEHAYQAMKTLDLPRRALIARAGVQNPKDDAYYGLPALFAGRQLSLRPDWDRVQVPIMEHLLRTKFKYPAFAEYLRATGDRDIYELSHPIFGRDGADHMSRILKQIRASL